MTELILKIVVSYLLGSIMGSLVMGRLRGGVDIRSLGSGNAGSTNALRTQGKGFALGVVLIDVGKGFLAARIVPNLVLPWAAPAPALYPWLAAACAAAAMVGHVYPIWYGFRGGKAVATFVGAVLGLAPVLMIPVLLTWAVALVLTGFVGLSSMLAAAALPLSVLALDRPAPLPLLAFGVFAALLIMLRHGKNIARMRSGTEPRARRVWLLGRGAAR
jgi:glycerol-3-phosphate acyltransferase PlsY